jgi:hypothetical protein
MMKKDIFVIFVFALGCDRAAEQATSHLRSMGYKSVTCVNDARGAAICTADEAHFRCASTNADGCGTEHVVACEHYYLEKPAP